MKKKIISLILNDLNKFFGLSTILSLLIIYIYFSYKNIRFDLTSDKRYTLSSSSIKTLDIIFSYCSWVDILSINLFKCASCDIRNSTALHA